MELKIEARPIITRKTRLQVTIVSVLIALPVIGIIFLAYGVNPLTAYERILYGAFGSFYSLSESITKSIPLMLCGVGLAAAFKIGFYNIGAEGQLLMGAIFGTGIALTFPEWPFYVLIPAMFASGLTGGLTWGLLPTFLKARYQINEVITTLMMNSIAVRILEFLVYGPWRGKEEWGFPYTSKFSATATLPTLGTTRIHYPTLIVAVASASFLWLLINRTVIGYEIRVVGNNPEAAKYAGMSYTKAIIIVMLISGGLAGLAGVGEVAGIQHRLRVGISPGYGYTSIIVAWLGQLHPVSTLVVALFFGGLLVGGEMIQISLGLPFGTIQMFNGVFLLAILSGEFFLRNRITFSLRSRAKIQDVMT
jgi:simple sugar transport system permease protein